MTANKITLLTTGQPSTNPRLVKEADALAAAGYQVTVLYSYWAAWAEETDKKLLAAKPWKAIQVGGSPQKQAWRWFYTRLRKKLSRRPERALCRTFDELLSKAIRTSTDLYIAHNLGALPAAALAAKKTRKLFGFDAEDFHRGEEDPNLSRDSPKALIEDRYLPLCAYTTAASPLIGAAYKNLFPELSWQPILNVFPASYQPDFQVGKGGPLNLFWFSQTLGQKRGIQDVILAMNEVPDVDIVLTLVGHSNAELQSYFLGLKRHENHQLIFLDPIPEEDLFQLSAQQDIGLALEPGFSPNNNMALSNKIFTYLLAGNAVIASDTDAQKQFMEQYPGIGRVYPIGDAQALAQIIRHYHENREELEATRRRAWELARTELNWEKEQTKFLQLIEHALASR